MNNWKNKFPKENRYFETTNGILYKGDCLEILKEFPKESVDLVLTDPPYNTGLTKKRGSSLLKCFFNDKYNDKEYYRLISNMFKLSYSILKTNRPAYIFINQKQLNNFINWNEQFELKQILIWDKIIHGLNFTYYAYKYEVILFLLKGEYRPKRIINKKDILRYQRVNLSKETGHQTVKPLSLINSLIIDNSNEHDIVLDIFIGSGTTAVSCEKLNRRWIGIELEEKYCQASKKRIIKEANQKKITKWFNRI